MLYTILINYQIKTNDFNIMIWFSNIELLVVSHVAVTSENKQREIQ